ncbi:MAG: T9SS type A sorting domain-containing protein, partial [Candidatus Cloacimonetes bacterium]|nr:T9SS type A sorting domain-containing protein [Candidatus Cloacimonadota bacterium]
DENFCAEQTYHYWLEIVELDGSTSMVGPQTITTTGQQEPGTPAVPKVYGLYQNYPNPFNPDTQISFSVPGTTRGQLVIYTTTGQVVKQLFDGIIQPQKIYTISWDGTDSTDKPVASGLYLYRLQTEKASYSRRMIMLK